MLVFVKSGCIFAKQTDNDTVKENKQMAKTCNNDAVYSN
jgi:hypothetical protein